jgi:hypothetical protein
LIPLSLIKERGRQGVRQKTRRCSMLKPPTVVFGVLLVVFFVGPAFAQGVDTAWVRRYNGSGNGSDHGMAMAVDDSGYVYVSGSVFMSGSGYDYGTIKYYPSGDTAWVRTYNGPGDSSDGAMDIAVDDSGYVYVTGQSFGSGTDYDYATVKYKPNGDTAWVRRYDGPENTGDCAMAIAIDGSGNVCVTGFGVCWSEHPWDYVTIKYYPNGDTAWVRGYNGAGDGSDKAVDIATDGSGNVYVTGESYGGGTDFDYCTIKYDASGTEVWAKIYNGPGNDYDNATAIAVDGSGNVYVTGQSNGNATGSDYATIKYYPSGDTAWVRRYDGPASGSDCARAVAADDSGFVYVTGYSDSTSTYQDYLTIKYDSSGNQIWVRRYDYGVSGSDNAYAIAVDGSGNAYITGMSGSGGVAGLDYATVKYLSNGDTAWVMRYNGTGSGSDYGQAIAVDDSGNVYVTGYGLGSGTEEDIYTIKYVQTASEVRDETGDRERPSEFVLSQNYPNPFNPTTKIEFTLAKSGFVTLQIYDVLGRKVKTLVSEELSSGYKSVIWDGKNDAGDEVASGVYFYQLKVGDFSEPKKMLLLK